MRKLFYILAVIAIAVSCSDKKEQKQMSVLPTDSTDSLRRIIEQKDADIQNMLNTINEIQVGFNEITLAEGRVTLEKQGEGIDVESKIKDDISFIANQMKKNRELIAKLQKQTREGSIDTEPLKNIIDGLTAQLDAKNKQLETLREELAKKDVRITELDNTVSSLNNDVANLKTESQQLNSTIKNQDKILNTAWYAYGTKKELSANHILDKGKVLQGSYNKSYFTKIDIRIDREIKLYSKSAKLLTSHPSSSYTLTEDANKQYVLRINDPQMFWSTSKYLVIQVK